MIPSTTERVPAHSADRINRRIEREMIQRLYYYQQHRDEIDQRLDELDQEWDIERTLETSASAFISSSVLTSLFTRKPSLLAAGVALFLLQHAIQGWCPPLPLFRRLGFRTRTEIDTERYALKMLRGDLDSMQANTEPETAVEVLQNARGPGHHLH
ncbi:MAG: hypothetical protein ACNA7W_07435 [Pseudomonadales bacterium]